jgi:hypothetical protein
VSENKSVFNWTFGKLLMKKPQLHKNIDDFKCIFILFELAKVNGL